MRFVPLSVMLVVLQQFLFFADGGDCYDGDDGLGPRGPCEYAMGAALQQRGQAQGHE